LGGEARGGEENTLDSSLRWNDRSYVRLTKAYSRVKPQKSARAGIGGNRYLSSASTPNPFVPGRRFLMLLVDIKVAIYIYSDLR
jgi:hypothetical protein